MASREAHKKKIDRLFADAEAAIIYIEKCAKRQRELFEELKLQKDSIFDLSDGDIRMIADTWHGPRRQLLQLPVVDLENIVWKLRNIREVFLRDKQERARRKERNQRFTVGALVKRDANPARSSDCHIPGTLYKRRLTREKYAKNSWGRYDYSLPKVIVDSRPWYEPIDKEFEFGMHAIVLDTKTSRTYIQIKLGNHDVWVKRGDLIVAQN